MGLTNERTHIEAGQIEPSCGTGSLAVGVSMLERGELITQGLVSLSFECGGDAIHMGGPDVTRLQMGVEDGTIVSIALSHSRVEILAEGRLWLNGKPRKTITGAVNENRSV